MTQLVSLFAFDGARRIAAGSSVEVALEVSTYLRSRPEAQPLIFNAGTGRQVDLDLRGTPEEIRARLAVGPAADVPKAGRGRPKLGVTAREVTLLPRHWDWLAAQPGGASVTLRKLIERASRTPDSKEQQQARAAAAYHFMHAVAGNLAGFEEASRALFAGNYEALGRTMAQWPGDIGAQVLALLETRAQA